MGGGVNFMKLINVINGRKVYKLTFAEFYIIVKILVDVVWQMKGYYLNATT